MIPEEHISKEYCAARSGGIERVQKMAERRLDGHGQKLDDLTAACIRLTAAVERVTLILERQEERLDQLENRNGRNFFESAAGKTLIRYLGIGLLILICAALGINAVQILKEVL
jgi:hypothetical protein